MSFSKAAGASLIASAAYEVYCAIDHEMMYRDSLKWAQTRATVTSVHINALTGNADRVEYEYTVDGKTYKSERMYSTPRFFSNEFARRRYWEGKAMRIHYDPADPAHSAAFNGVDRSVQAYLLGCAVMSIYFGSRLIRGLPVLNRGLQ